MLPYCKYPNMLDTIVDMIKTETNSDIKHHALSLIGTIGVIDHFECKKMSIKIKEMNDPEMFQDLITVAP